MVNIPLLFVFFRVTDFEIIFQYKLACAKCTDTFSEEDIFTHKIRCVRSNFDDISFLLTKENMMNVLAREISFMIKVLDNDLAQENVKLRADAQVYRLEKGENSLIVTAGKLKDLIQFILCISVN